jgi:hypothetical protein
MAAHPITRDELDRALATLKSDLAGKRDLDAAVSGLRIEWRDQMLVQVRWFAGLVIVQLFALVGAIGLLRLWP